MQTDIQMVRLRWLLALNVLATVLHYMDNVLFFPEYPEPPWNSPQIVTAFGFIVLATGVLGYTLIKQRKVRSGSLVLYGYSAMSLLAFGHYLVAPIDSVGFRITLFIFLEAFCAVSLAIYVACIQIRTGTLRQSDRA